MRSLCLLLFTVLSLSVAAQVGGGWFEITTEEPWQREALIEVGLDHCDFLELNDHRATALLTDDQRDSLERRGMTVRALPAAPSLMDVDGYLDLGEYESVMASWEATHPGIVDLFSLGTTWDGNDIWMLKISDNVASDEAEPEVLLISLQHAREWLAGMTLYGIVDHLITQYGIDPTVTSLVDSLEINVVLVANPDGYAHTFTPGNRFWRKNRRDNGDTTFGVDTNRNWEWEWNTASSSTSSNTYRGPAPLSEPETQALNTWVLSRGPDLIGMLNYHTSGTRIMHNWAYTYALPSNADVMGPLTRDMAMAIEAVNGQRMRNGSWSITLAYTGGGSTIDQFQAIFGVPALTFEGRPGDGGSGGFAPPGTEIVPSQTENVPGAIVFLEWARSLATDPSAPVLSTPVVSRISNTQVTISWTTDDPATRAVEFGPTASYGASEEPDRLRGITHEVTLTGLTPNMTYHAQAISENTATLVGMSGDFTFTTAATPQDITPPDKPAIDTLRFSPPGTVAISWLGLGSGYIGHRLYDSDDGGATWNLVLDESILTSAKTSEIFPAPPSGETRIYRLTSVDAAGNESGPSDTYGLRRDGGPSQALIVDGFDQWNSKAISQGGNHIFGASHALAMAPHGVTFDTCRNEMVLSTIDLSDYPIVVWVLGDESTGSETFSSAEQAEVLAYLEGGGNLLVSGSEVGWDLDRTTGPTAADRQFYNSVLFADFTDDDADAYDVDGTGGASIFGTRTVRFDEGSRGIYRVAGPDAFTPQSGAVGALQTGSGQIVALHREGTWGSGVAPSRLVYLGFPFETIFDEADRAAVMSDVLDFFDVSVPSGLTLLGAE